MEAELTALVRQREATYGEKERVDIDLEFSSGISVVFLTCFPAGRVLSKAFFRTRP